MDLWKVYHDKYKHCTVQVENRWSCNDLCDGGRDFFDLTEQTEAEVPGTWWHIPVQDLCMTSAANGSSGHTTHFTCSGTTVQHFCWGLTCWKVNSFATSGVVIRIHRGAFWYSHSLLRNGKKCEFCYCQKVIKLRLKKIRVSF